MNRQNSKLEQRLEQLERLRSEESPHPHDYPYYWLILDYNMTVWILAGNYTSFTLAAGLIRLHMPGVKKSRV